MAETLMAESRFLTEEDLWAALREGKNVTLIKGKFIDMTPAGKNHGKIAYKIALKIGAVVDKENLGSCYAAETGFVIAENPTTVLAPDFAFIQKERDRDQEKGFSKIVPDFVVEVTSPSDSISDVYEKVLMWLESGVRLAWVVDIKTRSITAYQKEKGEIHALVYLSDAAITCGDVIAGCSFKVSSVFE
ncbi:MAG: Uma2 family endonuclease [Chlorobiales bacterium]|nr:Uma2 family endonuclease [Chlorobiales bacterium]